MLFKSVSTFTFGGPCADHTIRDNRNEIDAHADDDAAAGIG